MPSRNRRDFVKAPEPRRGLCSILKPRLVRGSQANSALTVGLIGCGTPRHRYERHLRQERVRPS